MSTCVNHLIQRISTVRPRCPMRFIRTWEAHEAFEEQPWLVLLLARILKAASAVLVACAVLHTLTACGTAAEEAGERRGGSGVWMVAKGSGWRSSLEVVWF
jgi:hypothetical protein